MTSTKEDKLINRQNKLKPNNSIKRNMHTNSKTKQEIDFFITGPGTEADRAMSAETMLKCMMNLVMYLQKLDASKALSPYESKMM